jgi:hypothetical protein
VVFRVLHPIHLVARLILVFLAFSFETFIASASLMAPRKARNSDEEWRKHQEEITTLYQKKIPWIVSLNL